jgi:hypothetical protein
MRARRCLVVLALLGAVAGANGLRAEQGKSFDKLSDDDRAAFAARFKKEVWPLLLRDGKEGCVGCHGSGKGGGALRFSGNPERDFAMLLRDGFLIKDDAGSLLERVVDKDARRRMPPKRPAWKDADVQVLRTFVNDVHLKQQR